MYQTGLSTTALHLDELWISVTLSSVTERNVLNERRGLRLSARIKTIT